MNIIKPAITLVFSLTATILLAAPSAEAQERMLAASGGMIVKPGTRLGKVLVLNKQSSASIESITNQAAALSKLMRINVAVISEKMSYADAMQKHEAKACVVIEESGSRRLEYYPDDNVAVISVSALRADNPKPAFLNARVSKEVARALCYVCGAGASNTPDTLMGNKSSLKDLDNMVEAKYPMDVVARMRTYLNSLGITPEVKVPYIRACREGWAPHPTNDHQKAVWERVRTEKERGPTNAIQIKP